MPIYEYVCNKCKADFEELVLSQREQVACPECGSKRVKRAMSSFSFASSGKFSHAKGGGCGNCSASCGGSCGGSCSCSH